MSKSRKILGALLAIVMVFSVLSVCAFAAGDTYYESPEDAAKYTQSWSLGTPVSNGGSSYTIQVFLTTNYPVGPVGFKLEGAVVTAVASGSAYYANPLTTQTSDIGVVLIIPDTSSTVPSQTVNGLVATVTYTTSNANGVVSIAADAKNSENPGGTLVAARCTAGTVNASNFAVGQTASVDGVEITPPAGDVTLSGVNGAVVDDTTGYVYGIPGKTADIKTYLSTTGFVDVVANDAGAKNGTGAVINLYTDSSKGTLVKSYTLVIFGDLDGDGEAALPDAGILSQYANYVTDADSLTGAYYFAGDLDGDGEAALPDSGILSQYANYVTDVITVNPWA